MTTLDGVGARRFDSRHGAGLRRARARPASPASWAARCSEVSDTTTRVADGGGHLGRPEHPADRRQARPAHARRARASRSSCTPSSAMAAQRLAARLMVELCGARMVPGTIDEYPRAGRAARRCTCARARGEAARASDPEPTSPRRSSSGSASGSPQDGGGCDVDRALLARRRRAARGRPDRGGRAHPRPRQAADDAAGARGRRSGGLTAAASRCAGGSRTLLRDRGLSEIDRLQLHLAGDARRGCASRDVPAARGSRTRSARTRA